jgi:hypothetical protein
MDGLKAATERRAAKKVMARNMLLEMRWIDYANGNECSLMPLIRIVQFNIAPTQTTDRPLFELYPGIMVAICRLSGGRY